MDRHLDDERLHDLLEAELPSAEAASAEGHLSECEACADRLRELADTLEGLRELPGRARPPRDLWPEIRGRIAAGAGEEDGIPVIALPVGHGTAAGGAGEAPSAEHGVADRDTPGTVRGRDRGPREDGADRRWRRRRVSLTLPQLYAAGIALALLSGGSVWVGLSSRASAGAPGAAASTAAVSAPDRPLVRTASGRLERAVTDFETLLEEGRGVLDQRTLATIEESLADIDEAIEQARNALVRDPASPMLHRLLLSHQRAKLRILRQATQPLRPST